MLRVYYLRRESVSEVFALKEHIRSIFGIANHSIHISDTPEEAMEMTRVLCNRNSVDLLQYGHPGRFSELIPGLDRVKRAAENAGVKNGTYVIDSSSVLGLYGLRKTRDIDFIARSHREEEVMRINTGADSHHEYLPQYGVSADDLILNPRNYFWFRNIKLTSLEMVERLKQFREVPDAGKDRMDLGLIRLVACSRRAAVAKAAWDYLAFIHSSRRLDIRNFVMYMESVFFQNGYRSYCEEQENILLIDLSNSEMLVDVVKRLRKGHPLANIILVLSKESKKQEEITRYSNTILCLDKEHDLDFIWKVTQITELCIDSLWNHHIDVSYIMNWHTDFQYASILAFLSGAKERIAFVKNNLEEQERNYGVLLTGIRDVKGAYE